MKKTDKVLPNRLLRNQRKLHCWTQSQVAEKLGTTTVNVNRWESGITSPSLYFRQRLCDLFGKSAEELGIIPETERQEQAIAATTPSLSPHWNVPFRRNPFFTGREDVLSHLHEALIGSQVAVVTQPQAISGLGGIGKTQTAVEYAYRYQSSYQAVLWVKADSYELMIADVVNLAGLLNLPSPDERDQNRAVIGVKRWLNTHTGWLLILDNVEDLAMVNSFLPSTRNGHILLTTRGQATGSVAQRIELEQMEPEEAALFLLRRSKRIAPDAGLDTASSVDRTQAKFIAQEMGGLPLALDQAGAYIEETDCGLSGYLTRYQTRRATLLSLRGEAIADHPEPVATTWSLSLEKLNQINPAAIELLRLCAFLHPDGIPEEIITESAPDLGPLLGPVATDSLELDRAIRDLRTFSLMRRNPESHLLTIHRLVQAVLKDGMDEATQRQWAERAVHAVNRAFPEVTLATWPGCQRCLPHAQFCASLIDRWNMTSAEAISLLKKAGSYLLAGGWYREAESFYQRSLTIDEQVWGPEHPEVATDLTILGKLFYEQGKYTQAEPLFQRAIAIHKQLLGAEHLEIAENLTNLAMLYTAQGQYTQAESLFQQALTICERLLGPEHPEIAERLGYLGWLSYEQGKYAQAEALFQRALVLREQLLGPGHPQTARGLNNLGRLYYEQGKYVQAEPLFQRALALREQLLGPEHPHIATCINNLAVLYRAQGKYTLAELLFQRALALHEQTLGSKHPLVAEDLNDLAILYRMQGRYTDAEPLFQRALALREHMLGPEHPHTIDSLINLAVLYHEQGKYEQSEQLLYQALCINEQRLGPDHPFVASNLNHLARLYFTLGRYEQAETFFQRALVIRKQCLDSQHPEIAQTLSDLARLYHIQHRYVEAEPFYQQALLLFEHRPGPYSPRLATVLEHYADLLHTINHITEAKELEVRARAIRDQHTQENLS